MHHLILGTAGHIDHGKTSLIRALTGVDTDRLPEEKKRGITIELGYAHLALDPFRFGIVDVPGHEKFVRQMLAGATGMDIALLIVAADDSVKPQTVEHLDILRMLNLHHGIIVLTKSDLVEPEWIELVEDELKQLVKGTFLENAPIVRVSSPTGEGIESLKMSLREIAEKVIAARDNLESERPFRMAIDRSFTIAGHGTVVTGSVNSGRLCVGDQLEIQPGAIDVRVRGIQTHDHAVESLLRGQRGAVNVVGIHHDEIRRGQELARKGLLTASRSMILQVRTLPQLNRGLIDRQRVRFHLGTAETLGFVRLLANEQEELLPKSLVPSEQGIVQIFLSEPAVAVWNQPFVLRSESPVVTLGGGRVIHPESPRINRRNQTQLMAATKLTSSIPSERVSSLLYLSPIGRWNRNDLAASAGVNDVEPVIRELVDSKELKQLELSSNRVIQVHQLHLKEIAAIIEQKLEVFHNSNPLASGMTHEQIKGNFGYLRNLEIVDEVIKSMIAEGRLDKRQKLLGLRGRGPQLSKNEQTLLNDILQQYEQAGLQTPSPQELQNAVKKNRESIPQLLELACNRGDLIRVSGDYLIHNATMNLVIERVRNLLSKQSGATTSEIRQELDASRKYVVPLCEYLDQIGFTRREGDQRFMVSN